MDELLRKVGRRIDRRLGRKVSARLGLHHFTFHGPCMSCGEPYPTAPSAAELAVLKDLLDALTTGDDRNPQEAP